MKERLVSEPLSPLHDDLGDRPAAIGEPLPEMPLFLAPGLYVNVPLESSYMAAFEGITRRTRDRLTAPQ